MPEYSNMQLENYKNVWVFCEQRQGKLMPTDFELISEARRLADELGVAREKVPFTAGKIGNESSASIPLVLSAVQEQTELTQVCCCGFGVGLAIGIAMADFSAVEFLGVDTL